MDTNEGKGDRLVAIQEQIAQIDYTVEGAWKVKAALDQAMIDIISEQVANSSGYDKIKAAAKLVRANNTLMRTINKVNEPAPAYQPGLKSPK